MRSDRMLRITFNTIESGNLRTHEVTTETYPEWNPSTGFWVNEHFEISPRQDGFFYIMAHHIVMVEDVHCPYT